MAIELHHLNTHGMMEQAGNVLDGVVRLKERIAELEKLNHDLCERVTENDEIRLHWEEIEQTRAENERMKARIAELEEEIAELNRKHRLRNASEELPIDNDNVFVILENGFETTDRYDHDKGHWHYHWYTVKYWRPKPSAPKEDK